MLTYNLLSLSNLLLKCDRNLNLIYYLTNKFSVQITIVEVYKNADTDLRNSLFYD